MTFNLPNLAAPATGANSTRQPSRHSTSTRQSDSSSMDDQKDAHVTRAEVSEKETKAKKSMVFRIVGAIKNIEPPEPVIPERSHLERVPAWAR